MGRWSVSWSQLAMRQTISCCLSAVIEWVRHRHILGRGGDGSLKVGMPVILLFLLLHTNSTCGIIYVCAQRTDRPTESARSRLRVVRGLEKWGGWAPPCKNLGGSEHPLPPPPYFSAPAGLRNLWLWWKRFPQKTEWLVHNDKYF